MTGESSSAPLVLNVIVGMVSQERMRWFTSDANLGTSGKGGRTGPDGSGVGTKICRPLVSIKNVSYEASTITLCQLLIPAHLFLPAND